MLMEHSPFKTEQVKADRGYFDCVCPIGPSSVRESAPWSMHKIWTMLQRDGPNHLGLMGELRVFFGGTQALLDAFDQISRSAPHQRDDATLSTLPTCHLFGCAHLQDVLKR